jgi:hypothetical protein
MLANIMMKREKEYLAVSRMPGSKPGAIPFERRDYRMDIDPAWGNPEDWMDVARILNVDGVAFFDEIDSPGEVIYKEVR